MADANQNIICAPDDCAIKISKWKVREGFPVTSGSIILFYEQLDGSDKEVKRLKATKSGVVKRRLAREGATVAKGKPVLELGQCSHTTVIKDMCADCGADLRQDEPSSSSSKASVPMIHSVPELKVTETLAKKLGQADTERLLSDRKLVLLVDLDQTLIHTTNDNVPNNLKDVYHFQLYGPNSPWYHTRLRPGALEFLAKMHPYYELHICTFGARNYAHMIAQFLDKDGNFFSHRILSRDECFNATSKTDNLKALFPCGDSMVCIIDDREDVWNMASNLIQVKPYHFFRHTGDINAPPGMSKNELDGKGVDFKELMSQSQKGKKSKEADDEGRPPTPKLQASTGGGKQQPCEKSMPEHVLDDNAEEEDESTAAVEKSNPEDTSDKGEATATKDEKEAVEDAVPTSTDNSCTVEDGKEKEIESKENEATAKQESDAGKETREGEAENEEQPQEHQTPDMKVKAETEAETDATAETDVTAKTEAKAETETETEAKAEPEENADVAEQVDKITTESDGKSKAAAKEENSSARNTKQEKELIELEDPDDYLLYLEHILLKIHETFYEEYDKSKTISDLKQLIPQVKARVLVGAKLCFSGLIPNNVKLEQSKAYLIARSLGAAVTQNLEPTTTHLVAVTIGTSKVNNARKNPKIKIVTPEWLWSCAERWEHVEELLYPLKASNPAKMRQPPPHCHSPEHAVNYGAVVKSREEPKFMDTVNPLLSFSNDDLDAMNNDFDDFFESDDSSSDDEPVDIENPPMEKALRKRKRVEEIETNRGRHNIFRKRVEEEQEKEENRRILKYDNPENNDENSQTNASSEDEDESPSAKFRRGENLPSDLDMGSNSEGSDEPIDDVDDGDWNMMGAALEREFLGLDD
ncbi:RNA polymerase II subunit A C-terminal domain phosphatase [Anopheles arabiensis]|uniref:RNA polymerase II subunit A C-terminal domain phosphatase n=1 Tax=Anopheles arabiensis TaxID=7173 RepID=UPI001AACBC3A|nr:RNA polymerase II subunit A C-terminal domain phosphatase [Anopheles arabiensis]